MWRANKNQILTAADTAISKWIGWGVNWIKHGESAGTRSGGLVVVLATRTRSYDYRSQSPQQERCTKVKQIKEENKKHRIKQQKVRKSVWTHLEFFSSYLRRVLTSEHEKVEKYGELPKCGREWVMFVLKPNVEENSTTTDIHCWSGCRINAPKQKQKANRLKMRSIGPQSPGSNMQRQGSGELSHMVSVQSIE